jgi:hypothetical protein
MRVKADLYLYDGAANTFHIHQEGVQAVIQRMERFRYVLFMVGAGDQVLVGQPICNEIFPQYDMPHLSIIWLYTLGSTVYTWSAKFATRENDLAFKDCFSRCLYETVMQKPFDDMKEEDKGLILAAMKDEVDEETSSVMDPRDEMTEEDTKDFEDMDVDESPEKEDSDEEESAAGKPGRGRNKLLAISGKHNRALVVRGSEIGVFGTTTDKKLEFKARIGQIKDQSGALFSPRRVMLH